jgi:hypothetical protein
VAAVWWTLGVVTYALIGVFAFGVLMRMMGKHWDYDGFESVLGMLGALFWPVVLFYGVVVGVTLCIMAVLMLLASVTRIDRLLKWLVGFGNGGL